MEKHPIENIMTTAMDSLRDMVDVNTIIGDPVAAGDGTTIVPISKVSFGFVSGGGEYECAQTGKHPQEPSEGKLPFAGGAGAGVTVSPVGFLVISGENTRLLPAQPYAPADRIIELAPQVLTELKGWLEEARIKCANKKDAKKQNVREDAKALPDSEI